MHKNNRKLSIILFYHIGGCHITTYNGMGCDWIIANTFLIFIFAIIFKVPCFGTISSSKHCISNKTNTNNNFIQTAKDKKKTAPNSQKTKIIFQKRCKNVQG